MLINRDEAIAAVAAVQTHFDDGTVRHPLPVLADATYALRALPVSDGWEDIARKGPTDEAMDSAFKAYNYKYFGDYELSEDQWDAVHTMVSAMEAFKSLRVALGPLPAPPTIE